MDGYSDDPTTRRIAKDLRDVAKGAKPNDIVFLNQGGPPFLILEGKPSGMWSQGKDGNTTVCVDLNVRLTPEQKERVAKSKKLQIEVFD